MWEGNIGKTHTSNKRTSTTGELNISQIRPLQRKKNTSWTGKRSKSFYQRAKNTTIGSGRPLRSRYEPKVTVNLDEGACVLPDTGDAVLKKLTDCRGRGQTIQNDHTSIKQLIWHLTATSGDPSEEDCRMTAAETCQGKKPWLSCLSIWTVFMS